MAKDTKGQVESLLAELGKKIDHLISETKDASGDVREDVEKKIKNLKKRKEKLEEDFESYRDKSDDKWHDAKTHLSGALHELKLAVEALFKESKG